MSIRFLGICSFLLVVAAQTPLAAVETSLSAPPTLVPMPEKVLPSVVSIAVTGTSQSDTTPLLADPFLHQVFENLGPLPPAERPFQVAGSGVIVDAAEGLLLTNAHVVANAEQITIRLMDGTETDAKVVGVDPENGVAAPRMAPEGLAEIPIGQPPRLPGLFLTEDQTRIMVAAVTPTSGAACAGLMVGGRTVAAGNTPVDRIDQFGDAVAAAAADDPVLIEVERPGRPFLLAPPQRPVV